MKLKLIGEILRGFGFHYYGNPDRVFIKEDKGHAIAPQDGRVKVSETTLVVPHEGQKKSDEQGQGLVEYVLILLFVGAVLVWILFTIGGISAPERCAITFKEILSFWENFCNAPLPR